jgi:hypothetical protein
LNQLLWMSYMPCFTQPFFPRYFSSILDATRQVALIVWHHVIPLVVLYRARHFPDLLPSRQHQQARVTVVVSATP